MHWHHTPKKDVASCEKPRGAASRLRSVDIRMGEPGRGNARSSMDESIVHERGTRGSETSKYPQEEKINNDSLSSGERTGKRPNRGACSPGLWVSIRHCKTLIEEIWKGQPERVRAPYMKASSSQLKPEYRRARGIRREAGWTTIQA